MSSVWLKISFKINLIIIAFILNVNLFTFQSYAKTQKNQHSFYQIDSIVADGIAKKAFPGCQVLVLQNGKILFEKNYGKLTYEGNLKVESSTIYDLASLTKTTGTLVALMKLYDDKKFKLEDKVSDYLHFLKNTDKKNIRIIDLLFHESGLPAYAGFKSDQNLKSSSEIHSQAMQTIAKLKLGPPSYLYSCVNFILLKELIETISGINIDKYLEQEFFEPMDLKDIGYIAKNNFDIHRIAPTLKFVKKLNGPLQGTVHDPDAEFLGGISGNAGLFANARTVAAIHQLIFNNGVYNGKMLLSSETCRTFTNTVSPSGRRGLGYDKPQPAKPNINPCSPLAPTSTYGHTGYTGTCCWVDPTNNLIFVFLSNRTYPVDNENRLAKMSIRPKIQDVIYRYLNQSKTN